MNPRVWSKVSTLLLKVNVGKERRLLCTTLPQVCEDKIRRRNEELWQEHHRLKTDFPQVSHGDFQVDAEMAYRKRLIYRSKQCGLLEVDLLMGSWAAKNVPYLSMEDLKQYEIILNLETVDILHFITGGELPKELDTQMMHTLRKYCASSPIGKSSPEEFEKNKKYMSN